MSLTYCDIEASWVIDGGQGLHSIFNYRVTQSDGSSPETEDAAMPRTSQYCQLSYDCAIPVPESGRPEACVLQLVCKVPYNISMLGMSIISESRTQELYDTDDVYMMTTSSNVTNSSQNDLPLYSSQAHWDKPLQGCSIKFLSLGERTSFRVYRVVVELVQGKGESPSLPPQPGHIDMGKVKVMVDSMGGQLSDRAQSFMTTMEQYQQNKEATLAGVESLLSQSSPAAGGKMSGAGDMSRLLTMFASMNKLQQRPPATIDVNGLSKALSDPAVTGRNGGVSTENPPAMFSLLKDICGKVSRMREVEGKAKVDGLLEEDDAKDEPNADSNPPSEAAPMMSAREVERFLLQHLAAMEQRLEAAIDRRMSAVEDVVNKKLDRILELLTRPVRTPPGGYETSDDSSMSSTGELTLD